MSSAPHSAVLADDELLERVREALAAGAAPPTPARVASALRSCGAVLGDATVLEITGRLRAEIVGAGPLEALVHEPGVTDVLVNGPGEIWVDRGGGLERAAVRFRDDAAVRTLAQRLAATAGRRLDDAVPYVDARLAGGVRLHAVLPPIAPRGPLISLRVPAAHTFTLDELVAVGSVPEALAPWVDAIVRARLAFLVTGGTGTGKTTILGALLSRCDPGERIVVVEDSGELRPDHPHVVRLEARPANVEGAGQIGLDQLVRQALRMRPDRLVVGEVRGAEIVDLLAALNTGHEGGCGTLHANSAADVPARIEALGIAAGLPGPAIQAQAASALQVVVHLARDHSGRHDAAASGAQRRWVSEIHVVDRRGGELTTASAFAVSADGRVDHGPGRDHLGRLLARRGVTP